MPVITGRFEARVCTKEKPDTGAWVHIVTPRMTSEYKLGPLNKSGKSEIRTDYKCIHCGLEITTVEEAKL